MAVSYENIDFEEYKINELFDVLSWMPGEEMPSKFLVKKKTKIVELIAEQLGLETKEVIWMVEAREKKRLRQKMGEEERENTAMQTNNKNWHTLTREVETLVSQNTEIIHQHEILAQKLTEIGEKILRLEQEAFKEVQKEAEKKM